MLDWRCFAIRRKIAWCVWAMFQHFFRVFFSLLSLAPFSPFLILLKISSSLIPSALTTDGRNKLQGKTVCRRTRSTSCNLPYKVVSRFRNKRNKATDGRLRENKRHVYMYIIAKLYSLTIFVFTYLHICHNECSFLRCLFVKQSLLHIISGYE